MGNKAAVDFWRWCNSVIGTPYFYGAKYQTLKITFMLQMAAMYPKTVTSKYIAKAKKKGQVGKINVDCSGMHGYYTGHNIGSAQMHSQAYTRLPMNTWEDWAEGVTVWREGHVGTFGHDAFGKPCVVEAKGIDYGVICRPFNPNEWKCGLTFAWLDYSYKVNVQGKTWKQPNPYPYPAQIVKYGMKGTAVMWLQYELVEAGYTLKIDGDFGPKTKAALLAFQKSAKLKADAKAGDKTKAALLGN